MPEAVSNGTTNPKLSLLTDIVGRQMFHCGNLQVPRKKQVSPDSHAELELKTIAMLLAHKEPLWLAAVRFAFKVVLKTPVFWGKSFTFSALFIFLLMTEW
ncbi:hypothetical protein HOLleu_30455 [Holothuria leucospilota]|uniref:Uncharacterized protein n=1 Tax=Holothuria leucospilota TaxID=206669 RepID=A0A9Q1BKQ6_HOLLE|nr:hypothetical protein HOLleu_30455 [Holothuria leucospilota]